MVLSSSTATVSPPEKVNRIRIFPASVPESEGFSPVLVLFKGDSASFDVLLSVSMLAPFLAEEGGILDELSFEQAASKTMQHKDKIKRIAFLIILTITPPFPVLFS